MRLSPNIEANDLNTKIGSARKFLEKGNKVKVTLRFRGREMAHMTASKHILDDFAKALEECAVVEKPAKVEGRSRNVKYYMHNFKEDFYHAKNEDKQSCCKAF